ncbi:MAG: glycosyl transferase family 1 [Phycisphaerae bacterium SM1_79]|nr:MAG: glycosyl transferase family 1 [Phycisphaerae bacterium SM1_79]
MLSVEDFRTIVPDETLAEIYSRARGLYGKHIVHINSTYQGGGVAEILYSLVLLMNDVGIDTGWRILHGSPDFFNVTKKFHNALQGASLNLSERKQQLYLQVNNSFGRFTHINHDCVIVHDPQPLALIKSYRKRQPWIWRCHIDLTDPHNQLWEFLKGFLLKYDQIVVSSKKYFKPDLPVDQRLMFPAINPLNLKNKELSEKTILKYIEKAGIPTDKPVITQVSRLDPWKDPEGVLEVFKRVREKVDCRLVFCYNLATDDPEGVQMYTKVQRKAKKLVDNGDVLFVVGNNDILVNSIQRFSSVIIQKSIKEGFCLSVTEALWKGRPVVASNVGGIPGQIEDGNNGFLLEPNDTEGFAERIAYLLKNPDDGQKLGRQAKETVRQKFLITRLLSDYLDMLNSIMRG